MLLRPQMPRSFFPIAAVLSVFASSAAYSGEACYNVSEELPKSVVGSISLYPSSDYFFGFDGYLKLVSTSSGIPCIHRDSSTRETLQCSNDILAIGIPKSRPCTFDEKYGIGNSVSARFTSALCAQFGTITETNWTLRDRNGQEFTDSAREWTSESPISGCVLTSSGNYEEKGFKVLTLRAGDSRLYFIREQRRIYVPKRQPAL